MRAAAGGIVRSRFGRPGAGTSGAASGVAAVMSLTLTVLGFLLATALVIVLARTSTSRWERAGRASVAAHREDVGVRATRPGVPSLPATVRRAVAAIRDSASLPSRVRAAARTVGTMADRVPVVRSLPPLLGRLRASLADERRRRTMRGRSRPRTAPDQDGASSGVPPSDRGRYRGARAVRSRRAAGAGSRLVARTARGPHGRLRDLLHRHGRTEAADLLRPEGDESATAR
jgi:hypothetical protein